jgi:hypothetical protein
MHPVPFAGIALIAVIATLLSGAASGAEFIESGTQVIDGTRVNTTVYHERGYATFSNDCGSQDISQSALQRGAKPTEIIPCPRASAKPRSKGKSKQLWGAIAAGLDEGNLFRRGRVSVGAATNFESEQAASNSALESCRSNGVTSCRVVGTFTGCGYATTSTDNSKPLVWTTGQDSQEVYQRCYDQISAGNCNHPPIGGCNAN